jgi:sulfide dehydrogenase cytochrome subunit
MNLINRPVAIGLLLAAGIALGKFASAAEPSAQTLSLPCAGCHGVNGVSAGDSMPTIAGLPKEYLTDLMLNTKGGERHSTIMGRLAKGYSEDECREIAGFFAEQDWVSADQQVDPKLAARGKEVHEDKCDACHEDGGKTQEDDMPRLAGQWRQYLDFQLYDYKHREPRMPQPRPMQKAIDSLSDEDLTALSHFYAGQK